MRNEIQVSKETFSLTPTTLDEAMKYADLISTSNFVPKEYKGKSGDILVAVQMGGEVGLKPMQALQNIAVINGRPCVWGDAALAVCMNSPHWEYMNEAYVESKDGNHKATCTIKRKGESDYTYTFSIEDAKKAGLWGRQGPWSSYPKRMLQMRARGFALRDKHTDALKGMILREEAEDYPTKIKNVSAEPSKVYESKADEIMDSMDDAVIVEEAPAKESLICRMVDRIKDLGGDDADICATANVESIFDLDEANDDHMEALKKLGKRLKDMGQ